MSRVANEYSELAARFGLAVLGEEPVSVSRVLAPPRPSEPRVGDTPPARSHQTKAAFQESSASAQVASLAGNVQRASSIASSQYGRAPESTQRTEESAGTTRKILDAYRQMIPIEALAEHVGTNFETVATALLEHLMGLQVPTSSLPGVFSQAWLIGDRSATLAFEELREASLTNVAARRRRSTRAVAWAIISLPGRPLASEPIAPAPADSPSKRVDAVSAQSLRQTSESVATEAEDLAQAYRDGRSVQEIIERSRLPKGSAKRELIRALCGYRVTARHQLPTTVEARQLLTEFGDQLRHDVRRGLSVEEAAHRAGLPAATVAWLLVFDPSRPLLDSEVNSSAALEDVRPAGHLRRWPAGVDVLEPSVRQVVYAFRGGQSVAEIQRRSQLTFDELLEALLLGLTGIDASEVGFDPIAARQFAEASGSVVVGQYDEGASIREIAVDLDVAPSLVAWSLIADPLARERPFGADASVQPS